MPYNQVNVSPSKLFVEMLDHIFTDAIGALRDGLEDARLERLAAEEQLQADVLLGDLTWETSYGLPGEGLPPRMSSDVTFRWSAWSQAAYRSWYVDGDYLEPPRITIEIVYRIRDLVRQPSPQEVCVALPAKSPVIGDKKLQRTGPTAKTIYDARLNVTDTVFEVPYKGDYFLNEAGLADGGKLDEHFNTLGGWIASTLVRLGDLKLRDSTT